ncbi:MAG: hypothetical protein HWD62_01425 [Cyclobacteriaceae bacterium]|nr:MAG: hypothetical protein HWD62_01425 [Cyclobacteriaceae bacterium]
MREVKHLSQRKYVQIRVFRKGNTAVSKNGKIEPSISTLEKLAAVFKVDIAEFFKSDNLEQEVNLPLTQKIKMIDTLAVGEQ